MYAPAKTLLLDVGNSRIKYAFSSTDPEQIHTLSCDSTDTLRPLLQQAQKVIIASVQSNEHTQLLVELCQEHQAEVMQVSTQAEAFGIKCAYQTVANLGIDRWLAVLGARLHTQQAVAVIDVGTAATCDFVVGDQHLGGWIAPGFQMMRRAVTTNTSRVFGDDTSPDSLQLGTDTPQCVNNGCLAMLHGMVLSATKQLQHHSDDYRIYVCGGDGTMISDVDPRIELKNDLVLQGLSRFQNLAV